MFTFNLLLFFWIELKFTLVLQSQCKHK